MNKPVGVGGVLSRAAVSTIGMAVQGIARFVYTLAIGRLAGPESLAEVNALLSVAVFASLFWPAPAGTAASRFIPAGGIAQSALVTLKRSFAISVVLLSIGSIAAAWLLGSSLAQILGCAALTVGYSGYVFVRGVLIGQDRILRATIIDTVTSLAAVTVLILALLGDAHWALLLPLAVSYLLFTLMSWPRGTAKVTGETKHLVLAFTRDSTIAMVATGGLLPAVSMLILVFETPSVAGYFAAGLTLATPANQISQALSQVLVPQFAKMRGENPGHIQSFQLRMFMLSVIGFAVVFGALIILARWILTVFYGPEYQEGTIAMQLIMVGIFFMSIIASPLAFLIATGRQQLNAAIWSVTLAVSVIIMLVTGPALGQWGVLAGLLVGTVGGAIAVIIAGLVMPALRLRQSARLERK